MLKIETFLFVGSWGPSICYRLNVLLPWPKPPNSELRRVWGRLLAQSLCSLRLHVTMPGPFDMGLDVIQGVLMKDLTLKPLK